uniref:Retrovirus-related Pol polyprotein from transposon TNT 1-94 n=1 Tax=Tanacetum cinerariifolium TaxID=118510 RepID=A0A6L2M6A0_TANCI|nr:hypothetical protein [Tanacetum cinerariifolium]
MARQCTQPKRPRNAAWYKRKAMLAEAQEAGQILDEEKLTFLEDPGVPDGQAVQIIIPNNASFQTKDLDMYDSDCDNISNAHAVLMANIPTMVLTTFQRNLILKPILMIWKIKLSEDFRKRFTPQQEMDTEQVFWLRISNSTSKPFDASPVTIEAPKELPKIRTTPDARTEGMFKLDLIPLVPKLLQNREGHIDYHKYTQEQADILQGIVKQGKVKQSLDNALDFACCSDYSLVSGLWMFETHDREPLSAHELFEQAKMKQPLDNALDFCEKVVVTPKNKVKKVKFAKPLTSSSNIKWVESSTTSYSNTLVLSLTRLKCSTSNCGSMPSDNKKNDSISQKPSRNMKNKVEAQPRNVNKKNRVVEPIRNVDVNQSQLNANSELICATCKKSMFDGIHDRCLLDFVKNVNSRAKYAKKHKKQNISKLTGHVFTEVGCKWKPTGKTFTIVGNSIPLTRITLANVVPSKKTTSHSVESQKPELKNYSKKLKMLKV